MSDEPKMQPETPATFEQVFEVTHSPAIGELVKALALAQLKFKPVLKQTDNAAFMRGGKASKYADLATYVDATQGALASNGLVVLQWPDVTPDAKTMTLESILAHSSGEWMRGRITLPALGRDGFTAQSCGSSITYARRYSYAAIVGVASEDDDGNAASGRGSSEAAQEVANKKIGELKAKKAGNVSGYVPSLFYSFPPSHNGNTAFIKGDTELLAQFKETFTSKGKWSNVQNAFLIPADNFDDVKYIVEQAQVPFKKLEDVGA